MSTHKPASYVTCKNCGHRFEGYYCNMCRQAADTHRITWKEIAHHSIHALFHTDKGLLHTIKELIVRPGHSIREYLGGKRIDHFNPLLFLILTGGLATLIFFSLHLHLPNEEIKLEKIEAINATVAHKYFAVVGLLFIIILTATDYIFHNNKKYVLPEIVLSNTFQAGQIMVFTIALLPIFILQYYFLQTSGINIRTGILLKVISILFLFYTRYQFYEVNRNYWQMTKIAVQLIIVFVLYDFVVAKMIIFWQR